MVNCERYLDDACAESLHSLLCCTSFDKFHQLTFACLAKLAN